MGDNLKIRLLTDNLLKTLNESDLPIEVKRMCLKDILNEATKKADEQVKLELEELKNKEKEIE